MTEDYKDSTRYFNRNDMTPVEFIERELKHSLAIAKRMTEGLEVDKRGEASLALEIMHRMYPGYAEVLNCIEDVLGFFDSESKFNEGEGLLTATQIGARLEVSSREANKILIANGFQKKNEGESKYGSYVATSKGQEWAIRKGCLLKWYPSVIKQLKLASPI